MLASRGAQTREDPVGSLWLLSFYGSMPIGGVPVVSPLCAQSWGAFVERVSQYSAA